MLNLNSLQSALFRSVAFLTVWLLSVASLSADPVIDGILRAGDGYSHGYAVSADVERGPSISDAELYLNKGANGDMSVLLRFPRSLNDNSYGTTRIGWGSDAPSGKNHNFKDLEGSDTTDFSVRLASGGGDDDDDEGGSWLDFNLDFIDSQGGTLVHGLDGEGGVDSGNASDILASATSFSHNFSLYGASHPSLFVDNANSPAASNSYIVLDPTFSDWEFSIIYEFKIRGGALGNWDPSNPNSILEIGTSHHSPNKIAKNKVTNFRPGPPIDPPGGGGGGPVPDTFCAVNTAEDCGNGDPYGMWIPNLHDGHSDRTFEFSAGDFSGLSSGDAQLTAIGLLGNGNGFSIDVTFTDRMTTPPAGSPKGPIDPNCYTPDVADWFYYENFIGTLTGLPGTDYEGAVLRVTRREKAFQVGVGANRQTNDMGASGWFDWELLQQPTTGLSFGSGSNGDFNFALIQCTPELPTVSINNVKELECEGPMVFEICLSDASAEPVTVNFETQDGSAKAGEDYTGSASSIVIPAGSTCVSLNIPLIEDNQIERDEKFNVVLTGATGATLDDSEGEGTIGDCAPLVPEITISDLVVLECDGPAVFTICLSELSGSDVTVEYQTVNGSASNGSDYREAIGTLTIKAGEKCATVEVIIANDGLAEGDESFNLELRNAIGATIADNSGQAVVRDCERKPIEIAIKDATVLECDGPIRFEVCLSENAPSNFSIAWRTIAGSASSGDGDYNGTSGSRLDFVAGEKCKFIEIVVNNDDNNEGEETFQVSISRAPEGYTIVDELATGTIKDCDQPPTIADNLCVVDTGLNCGTGADYSMWIPNLHGDQSDITFQFSNGQFTGLQTGDAHLTAVATLGNGNGFVVDVTFTGRTEVPPSGSPKAPIGNCFEMDASDWFYYTGFTGTLTGLSGTDFEGAELTLSRRGEAFQVGVGANRQTNLLGASGWFDWEETNASDPVIEFNNSGNGDFNFELVECEPELPTVSIKGTSVLECEGPAVFEVCLSEASPVDVMIDFETQDGTATAPADYVSNSGQLTIPAGQLCGSIVVTIEDDTISENRETFTVVLTGVTGATIETGTGRGVIEDCEVELPKVSVADIRGILECEGPAIFTICLDEITKTVVEVTYETRDGSATEGLDYIGVRGTVRIPAGEQCVEVRVNLKEDLIVERDETFDLVLTGVTGATIDDGVGTATIKDCPPEPITISITDTRAKECEGPMTFQICLSRVSDTNITVSYSTADGSAIAGLDYTGGAGTITIPAGELCVDLEVPTLEDAIEESDESFFVNLSNPTAGAIGDGQGEGRIKDCPPELPTISINDISVIECKGPAVFEVCLSAVSATDVTVKFTTVDGTAVAPDDYTSTTGSITIPAGQLCQTFTIVVEDDGDDESPETFFVNLSQPTGATIDDGQGVGTIHDCDPVPPTISINNTGVLECDGPAVFQICLSEVSANEITVIYTTVDGTAEAPGDYTAGTGTVTIPAGTLCVDISVAVVNDNVDEDAETFIVNLSNPVNATIDDGQGVGTITDCEKPEISIEGKIVSECDETVVLNVCLTETSDFDVTVDFTTSNGSAEAGSDYVAKTGTVTIAAGQLCATITIDLLNENVVEPDETFLVTLSNVQGATITTGQATVTIEDCTVPPDEDPAITILDPNLVRECDADAVVFTLCLSEKSDDVVTVDWTTLDGSATAGQDYVAASGTITFAPGVLKAEVTIVLTNDDVDEAPEQFSVVLSNPTNATIKDGTAVATIQDCGDDPTAVELIGFSVEQDGLGGVLLNWTTASEFDTAGFELHRTSMGNSENFDLRKITQKMVLSRGSSGEGASYQYPDQPGFGRFVYQLEEIELDGHRERRGTVAVDVAPKIDEILMTENGVVVSFPTMEGWEYIVEVRDGLVSGSDWTPVLGAPHDSGEAVDTGAIDQPTRFYRLTARQK